MCKMKDELGRRYGPFIVYEAAPNREPTNGVVRWKLRCKNCGESIEVNGNAMRFNHSRKTCQYCGAYK